MGILEKIAEIEREISRTQKNKGNFIISCVNMPETHVAWKIYLVNTIFFVINVWLEYISLKYCFDNIEKQLNN